MNIGILALQGDVREHAVVLQKLGVTVIEVRTPKDLETIQGLIMPGGESTTIGKLMNRNGLDRAIIERYNAGMAIYGTCAGAILVAKEVIGSDQLRLGLIDISIARNAYGRQIDSFETEIKSNHFSKPLKAVFIRAPIIKKVGKCVDVLAIHENNPVLVRSGNILISTFHPELTDDTTVHEYFLEMIKKNKLVLA